MGDSYSDTQQNGHQGDGPRSGGRGGFRGGRGPSNREAGGFRIRLSDNEMKSARSLQEAFNLRSTVAVLGFALRTLGQMLEEGKLDELITQQRSEMPRGGNRREDSSRKGRIDGDNNRSNRGPKPNPFARPAKPQQQSQEKEEEVSQEPLESQEQLAEAFEEQNPKAESNQEELAATNEDDQKTSSPSPEEQ